MVVSELDLRRAMSERKRSETTYRAFFESANDAVLILRPEDEVVLEANERAAELYDVARDALIGMSLRAFSQDVGHGEEFVGETERDRRCEFETWQRRADGTPIAVQVSASLIEYEGRTAILSHNRDVTAMREAQEQLRHATSQVRRLALVASQTVNGVIITDTEGITEWVNDGFTRISGYTLDDLRGRRPGSLLQGPDSDSEAKQQMRHAIANVEAFEVEVVNYHKDGQAYIICIEAQPLFEEDGTHSGFMAIQTDVTDTRRRFEAEREARERTEEMLRLKSSFLNNMSHEIRTPLRVRL